MLTRDDVDRTLQRGLIPVYALGTAAGVATIVATPPSLLEVLGSTWPKLLGLLMLLGGGISLVGTLVPRGKAGDWLGEYAGLPSLVGGVALYGIVAAKTISGVPGRTAGVLLLLSFVSLLAVRWLRVRDDARRESGRKARKATHPPTSSPT